MKHINLISFWLVLALHFPIWAAKWSESLPLKSSEDKATSFLKVRTLIPTMADGAVRYGFDPVALFNYQTQIEEMVANDPIYQKLREAHPELMDISIYHGLSAATGPSEKELTWKVIQEKAMHTGHSLGLHTSEQVAAKIKDLVLSPLLGKSQGIIVGLSQLIEGSRKKEFFSMPPEDKVLFLQNHLPDEIVSKGFSPQKLGWNEPAITKEDIIVRYQDALKAEQQITDLIVFHMVLNKKEMEPKSYLTSWTLEGNSKKVLEQWFNANVAKQVPTPQPSVEPTLVLKEISPVVGMFRGFAGNDCSTICSFPFVNSPAEYTFLVYDSKGGLKGYAQGPHVLSGDKAVFYLHTIAGPRISKVDALSIINSFDQQKQKKGFDEILLPDSAKIDALINFLPVREAYKEATSNETMPLTYRDVGLRVNLKRTFQITKDYDDPLENKVGFRINKKNLGPEIAVSEKESASLSEISSKIDKNELITMLLQLGKNYIKNRHIISALAPHAEVTPAQVESLINIAANTERLSANELTEKMESTLKQLGFTFKERYFKKNISLIAHGLLNAKNLHLTPDLAEGIMLNLLEQRQISDVEKFLMRNPHFFKRNRLLEAFFKAYYNDVHEAEFVDSNSLALALEHNPKGILSNTSLIDILSKSTKSLGVIQSFISKNSLWAQHVPKSTGGVFLEGRQQIKDLLNHFYGLLIKTRNEAEFDQTMKELNLALKNLKMNSEDTSLFTKKIYILTMSHYLSLKPQNSLYGIFSFLSRYMAAEDQTAHTLRKMLAFVLQTAPVYQLGNALDTAERLRTQVSDKENIDTLVSKGLMARKDLYQIKTVGPNNYPYIKWDKVKAARCESVL